MKTFGISIAVALTMIAAVGAHHSLSAMYDQSKTEQIDGKVVQFSFRSPHSFLSLEVEDQNGVAQQWTVTWVAATVLTAAGITRDFFKIGDRLTITGNPGRNPDDHVMVVRTLYRPSDRFKWEFFFD